MSRRLKFIVNKQIISPDPDCDFAALVPGSNDYLEAEFSFSSDWDECAKVVAFYSMFGEEYTPQILSENICTIPQEALKRQKFKIQVIGKKDQYGLSTNKLVISQNGGIE